MPKVLGVIFAAVHFTAFAAFCIFMNIGSQDAMSGMLWGIWRTVDFPVSLLAFYGFVPQPLEWGISSFIEFIYPYVIHGVFGTAWWYFLPLFVARAFARFLPRG